MPREARASLGTGPASDLAKALASVHEVSVRLGVPVGDLVTAMLDVRSIASGSGTISLHDGTGVPLHGLGLGSARLLVAGMQRKAGGGSSMVLIDELEHGLEPHRIHRLLSELRAADAGKPPQVFATTHSPVVVKELAAEQLHVVRRDGDGVVTLRCVSSSGDVQGVVRSCPEALLSRTVLVCEGATEVGFVRGLDEFYSASGSVPLGALGVSFADGGGDNTYRRAIAFQAMGYRTAVLCDQDKDPDPDSVGEFERRGGRTFAWRKGKAIEEELFAALSDGAVGKMLEAAAFGRTKELVDSNIRSLSNGTMTLGQTEIGIMFGELDPSRRYFLGKAANKGKWFKSIGDMQPIAFGIIGPDLPTAAAEFTKVVDDMFAWMKA